MSDIDPEKIRRLCETHGVHRLELFGSALRSEMTDASDVDFAVDFGDQPTAGSFKRYMHLKFDLEALLGRPVDLIEVAAITNPFFLRAISDRRVIYAA